MPMLPAARFACLMLCTVIAAPVLAQAAWSDAQLRIIASLRLSQLPKLPEDPGNRFADDGHAAQLGRKLFFDARLSINGKVSCATCHQPEKQFQDGLPRGRAIGETPRRTQPLAGVAHGPWFFWDGRKDSLWAQALGPLEDAKEHGANRMRVAHWMVQYYRADYEAVFGPLPDLTGLPIDASPRGNTAERIAWRELPRERRHEISRVFANVGKAIAAFERTLVHMPGRFDRYAEALVRGARRIAPADNLTASEQNGLGIFIGKGQCTNCHMGPLFTDHYFHSTRVPPLQPGRFDLGRYLGADEALEDEFNCLRPFSDAKPAQCQELKFIVSGDPLLKRAFKTPGLRGVATRAPYMHAGQFATLREVIAHYIAAPEATPVQTRTGHGHNLGSELLPLELTPGEVDDLIAFLGTLDGAVVESNPARN